MSKNYDNYYVFADGYGKRFGKDVLAIIRRLTLDKEDFEKRLGCMREKLILSTGTLKCIETQLDLFNAKLHAQCKSFQDNGDGSAVRIIADNENKEKRMRLLGICKKIKDTHVKQETRVRFFQNEFDKVVAEISDFQNIGS
jgi:hypothetical protein